MISNQNHNSKNWFQIVWFQIVHNTACLRGRVLEMGLNVLQTIVDDVVDWRARCSVVQGIMDMEPSVVCRRASRHICQRDTQCIVCTIQRHTVLSVCPSSSSRHGCVNIKNTHTSAPSCLTVWNGLSSALRDGKLSLRTFGRHLKSHLKLRTIVNITGRRYGILRFGCNLHNVIVNWSLSTRLK